MKATKLVTAAALATIGFTLLAPTVLAAEGDAAKTLTGNGDITFTESTGKEDPKDPEKPDIVDPPGVVNPEGGPLGVNVITDLHFKGKDGADKANISINKGEFNASKPTSVDGRTTFDRGNWIQVTDSRAVDKNGPKGWTLSSQLTKQFTNADGQDLKGATITYTNPVVTAESDKVIPRTDLLSTPDFKIGTNLVLAFDAAGQSQPMLTAEKGKGAGQYYLQFGRGTEFSAVDDTTANSVKLTVPANTQTAASQYKAEITWTIASL